MPSSVCYWIPVGCGVLDYRHLTSIPNGKLSAKKIYPKSLYGYTAIVNEWTQEGVKLFPTEAPARAAKNRPGVVEAIDTARGSNRSAASPLHYSSIVLGAKRAILRV
ncbi:hypothetical protein J1614_000547 [Plenodomus biglobosus]|nr:hypothetical protein J1614_000547 [Plenodomus biglobosus]